MAYKKRVLMNMGNGIFDYKFDTARCECHSCFRYVVPETCGFSNTKYSFSGVKKDSLFVPQWLYKSRKKPKLEITLNTMI